MASKDTVPFSVSASQTADVVRYIGDQRARDERKSFEAEFVEFLKKYGIPHEAEQVLG